MDISSVEVTHFPKNRQVLLKDKLVDLSKPIVMGIIKTVEQQMKKKSFHALSNSCKKVQHALILEHFQRDLDPKLFQKNKKLSAFHNRFNGF